MKAILLIPGPCGFALPAADPSCHPPESTTDIGEVTDAIQAHRLGACGCNMDTRHGAAHITTCPELMQRALDELDGVALASDDVLEQVPLPVPPPTPRVNERARCLRSGRAWHGN